MANRANFKTVSTGADGWMTIEELSMRSGVTSRNIRAYQSRGLLAAPVARSGERSAFYSPEHLKRLRLVERLQARGFSLAGIADLLRAWGEGRTLEDVLGLESALEEATNENSVVVSNDQLLEDLAGVDDVDATIANLAALGMIEPCEDGYRIRLAKVFDLGVDAVRAGIPLEALLEEFAVLQEDMHRIALRYVDLFTKHVLSPYVEAGMPAERAKEISDQAARLRNLAAEASVPLMRQAIADETDAVARGTFESARRKREPGKG